ncbi:4-(cytidine 5'-diphospho)-2-C-methyl-D-erythritol kinase [bacterium]|nr:4-(cytidine 5'-diphospho)-2-C-methyl-D-erythritol kinase [bacterium]
MTVRSYAKINLGLYVLGKRDDGFHDLATVFHRVNLYDTLSFEATDSGVTLDCNRDDIPRDSGNLCVRAAEMLLRDERHTGVHMYLEKHIPAGAGLGGGSSNAAAVLRVLPELLGLSVPDEERMEIAAMLGSDVPFFLQDDSAEARGRGEILTPFSWQCPFYILLVYPGIHVSTAWAYGSLRVREPRPEPALREKIMQILHNSDALATVLHNDFEEVVMQQHPEIRHVRDRMMEMGSVGSLMSGSGSSVFGLFETTEQAAECAAQFPDHYVTSVTAPDFSPSHMVGDA